MPTFNNPRIINTTIVAIVVSGTLLMGNLQSKADTANIYSQSNSAKHGGEIGWISENQLSGSIKKLISELKIDEYTKPIPVPGGLIILYLNDKKQQERKLNFDEEFKKQITFERNKQLDQFSKIHFNKIKKNSTISEN